MAEPRMPDRRTVDPQFDGHHERALLDLSPSERLDWIGQAMQLLRAGRFVARDASGDERAGTV